MIRNIVVVSDIHGGCRLAVCPKSVKLDDGGTYHPSRYQKELLRHWIKFWTEYVPTATKNEPYVVIVNGDAIDGVHHGATTQISQNINDQLEVAYQLLAPQLDAKKCKAMYMIRGTEVHVGKSGKDEEVLAQRIGATPNADGQASRYEIWARYGSQQQFLLHATHHVGTTSSASYESTAVYKELIEAYNESGRWGDTPPDIIVRSHRHRNFSIKVPSEKGNAIVVCTPGWQLKTPFVYRLASGRASTPQIGGCVIREGADGMPYDMSYVVRMPRSKEEIL